MVDNTPSRSPHVPPQSHAGPARIPRAHMSVQGSLCETTFGTLRVVVVACSSVQTGCQGRD